MSFPVEYMIPFKPKVPSTHDVSVSTRSAGRVHFPDKGRRIVYLNTQDQQKEVLDKNPPGQAYFAVPTDVVSIEQEELIRKIVKEVLIELGLVSRPKKKKSSRKAAPTPSNEEDSEPSREDVALLGLLATEVAQDDDSGT